ncbi:MAG: hypothetical protein B1H40_02450 [Candidatus Latescibacteria bacterium 4484_181]|nr:MAG: hypothetical protein B1H40_02450 [Candidatus Latescibacteria bacterium 4484_181]RKY69581.1 MAG: hypothetical protein DRQ02_00625 [Candidatus Latescibacterota bacterium]
MSKWLWIFSMVLILIFSTAVGAQVRTTAFQPEGLHVIVGAIEPALRKWYIPQELYSEFGWEQWRYTNYAKDIYRRYTNIGLEGYRYYDIYGQYITKGWKVYDWSQDMPKDFGSAVFKSPKFSKWFDNVLVSSTRKGQYYTALTVGNEIRTTLTPLTFSKPTFNGVQLDFLSDKYAATVLTSRANQAGTVLSKDTSPPEAMTNFTNFVGLRGVVQIGRFASVGATYVNAHIGHSRMDWADYSLKGQLSTWQNATRVLEITIKLSDDSPEDGEAGAMLFQESIYIDGRKADITPVIKGGILREGHWEANGDMELLLVYNLSGWAYVDDQGILRDISSFKRVTFKLVLANDYKVEITSNAQRDEKGEEIFLPVTRAPGNVKDATNMKEVVFDYGLPTANQIYGLTFELKDLAGFSLRTEYDINTRYRRFPNPNPDIREHSLASDKSNAWYVTLQKLAHPWYAYAEAFSMDPDYSTTMYLTGLQGEVYYDNKYRYWFEFVDDNDDQDRWPDWRRKGSNQMASSDAERGIDIIGGGVFPGYDENNDLVPDFNQNWNYWPDYEEPFLRHTVDPPEYLFGMDMNNNTVVDRFENDEEPDYPFKKDHRGYNAYVGVEALPGVKFTAGHLREWTLSTDKRSEANYVLFTLERSFPGVGILRVFNNLKIVRDNIPDDLVQWQQLPGTRAGMVAFTDPLVCQNTRVNSAYVDFNYVGIDRLTFINKFKYDSYVQRKPQLNLRGYSDLLGVISKASYRLTPTKGMTFEPRIKGMFLRKRPFGKREPEQKDLWILPSLINRIPLFEYGLLESGLEYTVYRDLAERPDIEDFNNLVFAVQFSNASSYMGYKITSKVGFRQSIQYLTRGGRRTSSTIFVQIFAGVE